jgi:hypothetical protein
MVLLIVIDHKEPQHQQSFQDHAGESNADVEIQEGAHKGSHQQGERGQYVPPTARC